MKVSNKLDGTLMGLGLFLLFGIVITAQAGDPLCDGFTGVSKGLCNAGVAIGCFDDPDIEGCSPIVAASERIGLPPLPWLNTASCAYAELPDGVPDDGECVNVADVSLQDGFIMFTPCSFEGRGSGSGICAGHACNEVVHPVDCASVPEGTLCSPGPNSIFDFCIDGVCGGAWRSDGQPNWCLSGGRVQMTCAARRHGCYIDVLCDPFFLGCHSSPKVGCPTCDNPTPGAIIGCTDQNQCLFP